MTEQRPIDQTLTGQASHDMGRAQRQAERLRRLVAETRGDLPGRTEGTDRTGAVRVVLGGDGLPTSIEVAADWQHRVVASAFGDAVLDAFDTATRARVEAWSAALRRPRPAAPVHGDARYGRLPPVDATPARPMTMLVDEVLRAADDLVRRGAAPPATPTGTGSDGSGRLTLTLSAAGIESCTAPAHWLSCQYADDLNSALARALAAARADLGVAQAGQVDASGPDARPYRLLDELFAAFADPRRSGRS
jgi:hypothetical protein